MMSTLKLLDGKQQGAGRRPASQALGMWRVIELLETLA